MRYIFTVFISIHLFSFTNGQGLNKQVGQIVADTSNLFRKFRGEWNGNDSSYLSLMQLDGTQKNIISSVTDTVCWTYNAEIVNGVKKKTAFEIADEWKDKINSILGNKFKLIKYIPVSYNPSNYGWRFEAGNLIVLINVFPLPDSKSFTVTIGFLYISPEYIKRFLLNK